MKTYTDKEIQQQLNKAPYGGSRYTKDGVNHAKANLKIFRQIEDNKWTLISTDGINNPPFRAINLKKGGRIG